jgi:hypothetical protein
MFRTIELEIALSADGKAVLDVTVGARGSEAGSVVSILTVLRCRRAVSDEDL